jgi:hypothetical protein
MTRTSRPACLQYVADFLAGEELMIMQGLFQHISAGTFVFILCSAASFPWRHNFGLQGYAIAQT